MGMAETRFLSRAFKRYYHEVAGSIVQPHRMAEREFGIQVFGQVGMRRHIAVDHLNNLRLMLSTAPSDIYMSCSYYERPDREMDGKGWKAADLIFDIDAKDLAMPCRSGHTVLTCRECGLISMDVPCPKCGSARHGSVSVSCAKCMDAARREVGKLVDILVSDMGITAADIEVAFSGNDGFHVCARAPRLDALRRPARKKLAQYVMFRGAMPEMYGIRKEMRQSDLDKSLPRPNAPGWKGRLARKLFSTDVERALLIAGFDADVYNRFARFLKERAVDMGVAIDAHVTADTSRIFRMTGSLSSKSGLAKAPCADLDAFDPYVDACVLGGKQATVLANCPVKFGLGGATYGPYDGETVAVPEHAAAYMVCKGLASLA